MADSTAPHRHTVDDIDWPDLAEPEPAPPVVVPPPGPVLPDTTKTPFPHSAQSKATPAPGSLNAQTAAAMAGRWSR